LSPKRLSRASTPPLRHLPYLPSSLLLFDALLEVNLPPLPPCIPPPLPETDSARQSRERRPHVRMAYYVTNLACTSILTVKVCHDNGVDYATEDVVDKLPLDTLPSLSSHRPSRPSSKQLALPSAKDRLEPTTFANACRSPHAPQCSRSSTHSSRTTRARRAEIERMSAGDSFGYILFP
jgi:hypothetical protein